MSGVREAEGNLAAHRNFPFGCQALTTASLHIFVPLQGEALSVGRHQ